MKTNLLTRLQAIEIAGEEMVHRVSAKNCDFTNRVLQTPGVTEFSASEEYFNLEEGELVEIRITVYYYQSQDDIDEVDTLDLLEWEEAGYEIYHL